MTERYQVTLRLDPVVRRYDADAAASGRIPGQGIEIALVDGSSTAHLRVKQLNPEQNFGDLRLEVEVAAASDEEAVDYALTLAHRYIRFEAFAENALIALAPRVPGVKNLSHPEQLHPRFAVYSTVAHHSGTEVERTWHQLLALSNHAQRSALELALDWLYIGSIASDARTVFLSYWIALEFLVKPSQPRQTPMPLWLVKGAAAMRSRGIIVSDAELDRFRQARNAIVHEAGAGTTSQLIKPADAGRLREILASYVKCILTQVP